MGRDSSSFTNVENVYENAKVVKYECIAMYYVTRDHRKQNDFFFFSFQGVTESLTDAAKDKLQNYFGKALRCTRTKKCITS